MGMSAHNQYKMAGNADIATEDLGLLGRGIRNYQTNRQYDTYNMMGGGAYAGASGKTLRAQNENPSAINYGAPANPMYTMAGYV